MQPTFRDSKPRATKNSQRLYNLEEQERLYKNLGVTAMAGKDKDKNPENAQDMMSEGHGSHEESGEDHSPEIEEPESETEASKKSRRRSKESQDLSESDSDKDSDSTKKQKKKRKGKTQEGGFFSKIW